MKLRSGEARILLWRIDSSIRAAARTAGGAAMSREFLTTYLNDHFAGSEMAVELIALLRTIDNASVWRDIEAEIVEDRGELERLMRSAGSSPSTVRRMAAWAAEKLTELKVRVEDRSAGGALRRLELIEAVALGIDGKQALWTALQAAAAAAPDLQSLDYPRLIARAVAQRRVVETRRLDAASEALTS